MNNAPPEHVSSDMEVSDNEDFFYEQKSSTLWKIKTGADSHAIESLRSLPAASTHHSTPLYHHSQPTLLKSYGKKFTIDTNDSDNNSVASDDSDDSFRTAPSSPIISKGSILTEEHQDQGFDIDVLKGQLEDVEKDLEHLEMEKSTIDDIKTKLELELLSIEVKRSIELKRKKNCSHVSPSKKERRSRVRNTGTMSSVSRPTHTSPQAQQAQQTPPIMPVNVPVPVPVPMPINTTHPHLLSSDISTATATATATSTSELKGASTPLSYQDTTATKSTINTNPLPHPTENKPTHAPYSPPISLDTSPKPPAYQKSKLHYDSYSIPYNVPYGLPSPGPPIYSHEPSDPSLPNSTYPRINTTQNNTSTSKPHAASFVFAQKEMARHSTPMKNNPNDTKQVAKASDPQEAPQVPQASQAPQATQILAVQNNSTKNKTVSAAAIAEAIAVARAAKAAAKAAKAAAKGIKTLNGEMASMVPTANTTYAPGKKKKHPMHVYPAYIERPIAVPKTVKDTTEEINKQWPKLKSAVKKEPFLLDPINGEQNQKKTQNQSACALYSNTVTVNNKPVHDKGKQKMVDTKSVPAAPSVAVPDKSKVKSVEIQSAHDKSKKTAESKPIPDKEKQKSVDISVSGITPKKSISNTITLDTSHIETTHSIHLPSARKKKGLDTKPTPNATKQKAAVSKQPPTTVNLKPTVSKSTSAITKQSPVVSQPVLMTPKQTTTDSIESAYNKNSIKNPIIIDDDLSMQDKTASSSHQANTHPVLPENIDILDVLTTGQQTLKLRKHAKRRDARLNCTPPTPMSVALVTLLGVVDESKSQAQIQSNPAVSKKRPVQNDPKGKQPAFISQPTPTKPALSSPSTAPPTQKALHQHNPLAKETPQQNSKSVYKSDFEHPSKPVNHVQISHPSQPQNNKPPPSNNILSSEIKHENKKTKVEEAVAMKKQDKATTHVTTKAIEPKGPFLLDATIHPSKNITRVQTPPQSLSTSVSSFSNKSFSPYHSPLPPPYTITATKPSSQRNTVYTPYQSPLAFYGISHPALALAAPTPPILQPAKTDSTNNTLCKFEAVGGACNNDKCTSLHFRDF